MIFSCIFLLLIQTKIRNEKNCGIRSQKDEVKITPLRPKESAKYFPAAQDQPLPDLSFGDDCLSLSSSNAFSKRYYSAPLPLSFSCFVSCTHTSKPPIACQTDPPKIQNRHPHGAKRTGFSPFEHSFLKKSPLFSFCLLSSTNQFSIVHPCRTEPKLYSRSPFRSVCASALWTVLSHVV